MKVALAARLRAETTMTVGWIAERLAMGTRGYLNHLLYRRRKLGGELPISRTDPFMTLLLLTVLLTILPLLLTPFQNSYPSAAISSKAGKTPLMVGYRAN